MYISWLYDCQLLSVEMSETKFLQVIFHCGTFTSLVKCNFSSYTDTSSMKLLFQGSL